MSIWDRLVEIFAEELDRAVEKAIERSAEELFYKALEYGIEWLISQF